MYCADLGNGTKPHVHLLARAAHKQCVLAVYALPNTCSDMQESSRLLIAIFL